MYNNLNLLPYDKSLKLNGIDEKLKTLVIMKNFLEYLYIAIYCFKGQQLYKFDAHVGETLCQIRAYKILLLQISHPEFKHRILPELEDSLCVIYERLKKCIDEHKKALQAAGSSEFRNLNKKISIVDFFKSHQLFVQLPENAVFYFFHTSWLASNYTAQRDMQSLLMSTKLVTKCK